MKHRWRSLLLPYKAALGRFLERGPAASLRPAQQLGCRAMKLGMETLDLAHIHEQALVAQELPMDSPANRNRIIKRAGAFFAEAILPMEKTHRSAIEANIHLARLNQTLSRRTTDLAASNRRLKKEVKRRQVVEETLRQSEEHTGRLLDQSRRLQDQLRRLSRGILSVQEEERKRISRELHDVIAQVLTSINVRLAVLKSEATVNTRGLTKSISHTQRLVEKSVNIVRRFAYNLRPSVLDDLGLVPCLESFMTSFMEETGIRVSLTAFAGVEKLSNAKRTTLYRVIHEALTNIARHARASRGEVIIERRAKNVYMRIIDNGRSFDVEGVLRSRRFHRLGLLGMRERVEMVGGKFSIVSTPGKGTTIHAQIPFSTDPRDRTH